MKRTPVFERQDIPTQSDGPTRTMEMAGFFVTHAVWCVSNGDALVPLIGYEDPAGWTLLRLLDKRLEAGVERGERWIERNPQRVARAALVFDGHFIGGEEHTDALGVRIV